jgi:ABC transport system ATP-binding/permease protein
MPEYPVVYRIAVGEYYPVTTNAGGVEVGRSANADIPVPDLAFSRRQFRIVSVEGGFYVENLSQTNVTLLNGNRITAAVKLHHGDRIRVADCEFAFLEHSDEALESGTGWPELATMAERARALPLESRSSGNLEVTVVGPPGQVVMADFQGLQGERRLGPNTLVGRDAQRVHLHLPSSQVSRLHAQIVQVGGRFMLSDLGSANGVYVNGQRIRRAVELRVNDRVGIGPFSLLFTGAALEVSTCEGNTSLVANNLTYRVKDRTTGQSMVILDDVSLVIEPNEFVVFLGPSGSGKSTLMNAISARVPATEGTVYVNNEDLYLNFEAMKRNLALVPQRDVVHAQLTVWDALYYTAKLRLPQDTSDNEIIDEIEKSLAMLRLKERRSTPIGSLSGGQVKRVCLANEILADPSLLFLDEVTSGLDEQSDRELMSCFRDVADSGKTVICVTHSLTNVDRFCDLVVFLAPGGKLAFFGAPREALSFFGVPRLGDVYERMETKTPDEWMLLYRQSSYYNQYISRRQPRPTQMSRRTSVHPRPPWREVVASTFSQARTLVSRYAVTMLADRGAVAVAFGQAVLVAILLRILFGDLSRWKANDPGKLMVYSTQLLFLLSTSCIWFGCNNAAKEIVKEQSIYRRERDVNLLIASYYGSKVAVLGLLGFSQAVFLFGIVRLVCQLEGSWFPQLVLLSLATFAGTVLGLCISAAASTADVAATIVPIALIPQIVLSGAIAPLNGLAKLLATCLVANYWAFDALKATLPEGQRPSEIGSIAGGAFMLIVFVALSTVTAILMLKRADRNGGVLWRTLTQKVRMRLQAAQLRQ